MKNKASIFSNERTIASAGAGKTYALTNRFIALSRACSPEEICALTFTRMAAAEFLDKILTKLAKAASDPEFARILAGEISSMSADKMSADEFTPLLRKIVRSLPKLSLSTIDAFEMRFASAFSAELGFAGDIEIMDEFSSERAKRAALKGVLEHFSSSRELFESFATAVETASGGSLEREVFKGIMNYLGAARSMLALFPDVSRWGNCAIIKNSEPLLSEWNPESYALSLEALNASEGGQKKMLSPLKTFFSKSSLGDVYDGKSKPVKWLQERYRRLAGDDSTLEIYDGDDSALSPAQIEIIDSLVKNLIGGSLTSMCRTAHAVGAIASAYDKFYRRMTKRLGRFGFDDISAMLTDESASFARSLVEYRLDARYKHWLVDEFQDTSRIQWKILSNLVDEVLTDDSGERTFFYVGDRKQSIYGWRGGDSELFDEIFDSHGDSMRDTYPLDVSYRSSSPVINGVNAVFGSAELSQFDGAYPQWSRMWTEHRCHPSRGDNGCFAMLEAGDENDKISAIYGALREIDPCARSLSCAVLVNRNDYVRKIARALRAKSKADGFTLRVAEEVDSAISDDNMLIPAVVALFRAAAHPADSAAVGYVEMTPLKNIIKTENWRADILSDACEYGFERVCNDIFARLKNIGCASDDFTKSRMADLSSAAAEFDASFSPDVDLFVEFIRKYKIRESSKAGLVRVMTVHKSKGLDFDFVIMPQLENLRSSVSSVRLVPVDADDGGKTIVNLPSRPICEFSPNFSKAYAQWKNKSELESLCRFYVGVTRARSAVIFVGKFLSDSARDSAYSFEKHVNGVFSSSSELSFANRKSRLLFGTLDWYADCSVRDERICERTIEPLGYIDSEVSSAYSRATFPSEHSDGGAGESNLVGKNFGRIVHSILAYMTSSNPEGDVEAARLRIRGDSTEVDSAAELILNALKNPDIRALFTCQSSCATEYPFCVSTSEGVVSGIFDRICIDKNVDGRIESVRVVDFKTHSSAESPEYLRQKYASQMRDYMRSASAIFGLPQSAISGLLVALNSAKTLVFDASDCDF